MARPGFCQPATIEKTRVFPAAVIGNPIPTPFRILSWVGEWARRDPSVPHWHLGPVAVEPDLQGCGIGTAMLHAFCAIVDSTGANAYLETDKSENVRLYQCTHYERAPRSSQSSSATHACGGFAPAPPGFSALVPLPIESFAGQIAKGGRRSIPLVSVEATEAALGLLPSIALSSAQSALILQRVIREADVCGWF